MKSKLVMALAVLSTVALAPTATANSGELHIYWSDGHAGCEHTVQPHPFPPDVGVYVKVECESNVECTIQAVPPRIDCNGLPP